MHAIEKKNEGEEREFMHSHFNNNNNILKILKSFYSLSMAFEHHSNGFTSFFCMFLIYIKIIIIKRQPQKEKQSRVKFMGRQIKKDN
jgi:hypothetical protein